jgi:hypothetical protein
MNLENQNDLHFEKVGIKAHFINKQFVLKKIMRPASVCACDATLYDSCSFNFGVWIEVDQLAFLESPFSPKSPPLSSLPQPLLGSLPSSPAASLPAVRGDGTLPKL